jgi:two-component system, chemotaxis family, protein-glutamate methylesterase/glutaminase
MVNKRIRVLVVDDSQNMRRLLTETLASDPKIEVVGAAADPYEARDLIVALRPDVLTLDIEMPRMDGITFLGKLMAKLPMPVIVVSTLCQSGSQAVVEALRLGAVEALVKPAGAREIPEFRQQLLLKVLGAAGARFRGPSATSMAAVTKSGLPGRPSSRILAVGASTGGTQAVEVLLQQLPASIPGMVVVQHIPPVFSRSFADRLNQCCVQTVKEAEDGDLVSDGHVLIAPGGLHLVLARQGNEYRVRLRKGPPVHYQRPAVDVLFRSVAAVAGASALGVILTGMGSDGAAGLKQMRDAGSWTIAQDEQSCVVYGMPLAAVEADAVCEVLPLERIGAAMLQGLSRPQRPKAYHQELVSTSTR